MRGPGASRILRRTRRTKEGEEAIHECLVRFNLALPGDENPPSVAGETLLVLPVPLDVASELGLPELLARPGSVGLAASVPVPETAVNEDRGASFREDDVGPTGQTADVGPKPVAEGVERPANYEFGLRIDTTDAAHERATVMRRQVVGQRRLLDDAGTPSV